MSSSECSFSFYELIVQREWISCQRVNLWLLKSLTSWIWFRSWLRNLYITMSVTSLGGLGCYCSTPTISINTLATTWSSVGVTFSNESRILQQRVLSGPSGGIAQIIQIRCAFILVTLITATFQSIFTYVSLSSTIHPLYLSLVCRILVYIHSISLVAIDSSVSIPIQFSYFVNY